MNTRRREGRNERRKEGKKHSLIVLKIVSVVSRKTSQETGD